ncbi:hypothetical protein STCU_10604 [Strigomonas culicis]|uniref:Uncharacterized protein n=1 Tax=Strigomonas culicis TaxID=28005 RepID=S9TM65_9TRYP|nr:hypothetical protein STCU_10604 [Strigomonas culicis]|eukprot:EPY17448.1 hypothetical protein STCU_10604 [Strigomonas culicis]
MYSFSSFFSTSFHDHICYDALYIFLFTCICTNMSTDVCVRPFHFLHLCVAPCVAGILWLRACVPIVCSSPSPLLCCFLLHW